MAGTTNFIQFNPTAANQETDSAYSGDSQRQNGAINGQLFNDILANKAFYQWSTFITALANALVNKNYSPNDTDINTLESVLANIVTFNDLKSNLSLVAFSPTPIFNATSTNGFDFTLAGNVTSSTLTGQAIGQILTFVITQGATPYTFVPPAILNGWDPVSTLPNSITVQRFIVKEDGTIWNVASSVSPTTLMFTRSGKSFNTAYQNTSGYRMTVAANCFLTGGVGQGINCYGNVASSSGSLPFSGPNSSTAATNSVTNSAGYTGVTFVVPPGYWYNFTWDDVPGNSSVPTLSYWTEWIN